MYVMADRIEREIEEILAKLDVGDGADTITGEREPIPLESRRKGRSRLRRQRPRRDWSLPLNPAALLFAGAGVMIGGLIFASFWEPLIWLSFAGIVLFLAAFVWSFFRRAPSGSAGSNGGGQRGVYWRDRYIEYEPAQPSARDRVRRFFRRQ